MGSGAIAGFGLTAGGIFFVRNYLLDSVKAGHIAVMAELMAGGDVPGGRCHLDDASAVVKEPFGAVCAGPGYCGGGGQGLMPILAMPDLDKIMGLMRACFRVAVGLVDKVILAYANTTKAKKWASAPG